MKNLFRKEIIVGYITYLPHGAEGHGVRMDPVVSSRRSLRRQACIETIRLELIRDALCGRLGCFLLWDENVKGEEA